MGVSLTLLTLHVLLVLLVNAITLRAREPLPSSERRPGLFRFRRAGPPQDEKFKVGERRMQDGPFVPGERSREENGQFLKRGKGRLNVGNRGHGYEMRLPERNHGWEDRKPDGPSAVCGDGHCRCFGGGYADCSGHEGKLTYIPRLPASVWFLNFSHNNLGSIQSKDFFINVTGISGLSLSDNNLFHINPDAVINSLKNLTELYLGFNYNLTFDDVLIFVKASGATLQRLDVRGGKLPDFPEDFFFKYPTPNLRGLGLFGNRMTILNMTALTPLKQLQYISLEQNHICAVITDHMPALIVLNLRNNCIVTFPKTCGTGGSLFPSLQRLDLSQNSIMNLTWKRSDQTQTSAYKPGPSGNDGFTEENALRGKTGLADDPGLTEEPGLPSEVSSLFGAQVSADQPGLSDRICLPGLWDLDLSDTPILEIPADTFGAQNFPSLYELHLDSLTHLNKIEKNAFNNPRLTLLFLRWGTLHPSSEVCSDLGMFSGLTNLGYLYLDSNGFCDATETKFKQLFAPLKSLKTLSLKRNSLSQIDDGVFDNLGNLSVLRLSSNMISMVKESTFSPASRSRLTHLDLSNNPFNCSSDLKWFCSWMRTNPALFANSSSGYKCANLNDTDVTSICTSMTSHSAETKGPKVIVYREFRLSFLITKGGGSGAQPSQQKEHRDRKWVILDNHKAHNPWSHDLYKVAILSASLVILLIFLTLVAMVCCIHHGTPHKRSSIDVRSFAKSNGWKHLVEEKVVTCPTVTATEKK